MAPPRKVNVPIARTSLSESDIASVLEPLKSGWLVQGPKVRAFEEEWALFTGAKNAVAVTSCTSALHLSLAALGFGPEDEAIVPAFTWISTANVVEQLGGKVIFCDIDLDTFNIDTSQIEEKITQKTKVILPVHLFGLSADMRPIIELARRHNLSIVEDAACGFGSFYKNAHVGTLGDTGCFSFHPRKAITTGEGGMVTTDSSVLAEKLRRLRDHGAVASDLKRHTSAQPHLLADHTHAGYNYRMTDIQAALGCAQMKRATNIVTERRALASNYQSQLGNLHWLRVPSTSYLGEHGYQSFACLFAPEKISTESISKIKTLRNEWMESLYEDGISTRPATHAVHMLRYYKNKYDIKPEDFPNAWAANDCSISLPIYNGMREDEQAYVIDHVLKREN